MPFPVHLWDTLCHPARCVLAAEVVTEEVLEAVLEVDPVLELSKSVSLVGI